MPKLPALRVYLDANVLFSASLNEGSDFFAFWRLREVIPVTSPYAIGEVARNIHSPTHRLRFEGLITKTDIVSDVDIRFVPSHIDLVDKDRPILAAAIAASVDYLLTGDKHHFSRLYGTTVSGVHVLSPGEFIALYEGRIIL